MSFRIRNTDTLHYKLLKTTSNSYFYATREPFRFETVKHKLVLISSEAHSELNWPVAENLCSLLYLEPLEMYEYLVLSILILSEGVVSQDDLLCTRGDSTVVDGGKIDILR